MDGPRHDADDEIDFGRLVAPARADRALPIETPAVDPVEAVPPTADVLRTEATAAFTPDGTEGPGVLRASDGTTIDLDAPVMVGRRPPTDPIAEVVPTVIAIDDQRLSRHHVTLRVVDGLLVVLDEDSTNGTFLLDRDEVGAERRRRCPPGRPVELPLGSAIDVGGVVTLVHEPQRSSGPAGATC